MAQIKWITVIVFISTTFMLVQCKEETTESPTNNGNDNKVEKTKEDNLLDSLKANAKPGDVIITDAYETEYLNDGVFESFYPDSTIKVMGTIVNGKRECVWTSFHPNGNLQSENNYKNGVLDGKCLAKTPNGQMLYIGYYFNGKYDGQWLYFNKNGEIDKEVLYKKGEVKSIIQGEDLPK